MHPCLAGSDLGLLKRDKMLQARYIVWIEGIKEKIWFRCQLSDEIPPAVGQTRHLVPSTDVFEQFCRQ